MNYDTPNHRWKIQVAKLKLMYPHLNDDDFKFDYGMKDVMLNNLQLKLGKTREQLNELFDTLSK